MSSRTCLRRKVVLAVTVIRNDGQEKQLAHTLDLTASSARLGGLTALLEPGEVIELQRGPTRARFQVVWMGAPGSAMSGQAGIRNLEPGKLIWNVTLPEEETDLAVDTANVRTAMPSVGTTTPPGAKSTRVLGTPAALKFPGERRWHERYSCGGTVAVKTERSSFALNVEVKDISQGGLYAETNTPLPVNSTVNLTVSIEGIVFEAEGLVRTSYPLVGMGISFQKLTPPMAERLALALQRVKGKIASSESSRMATPPQTPPSGRSGAEMDENPAPVLAVACRKLAQEFESWKRARSSMEIEDLRQAIEQLQRKLSPVRESQFIEYLAGPFQSGGTA